MNRLPPCRTNESDASAKGDDRQYDKKNLRKHGSGQIVCLNEVSSRLNKRRQKVIFYRLPKHPVRQYIRFPESQITCVVEPSHPPRIGTRGSCRRRNFRNKQDRAREERNGKG